MNINLEIKEKLKRSNSENSEKVANEKIMNYLFDRKSKKIFTLSKETKKVIEYE